jgi:RND family efflux transporter MFP subunit
MTKNTKRKRNNTKATKSRKIISYVIILVLLIDAGIFSASLINSRAHADTPMGQTAAVKSIDSQIVVDGTVTAQNEADLHFQTGGKLTYLPVKEGDKVIEGQTVAQLDTYSLQQQLAQAVDAYKSTQDSVNQTQENQNAGVVAAQQRTSLDQSVNNNTNNSYTGTTEENLVQNAAKRLIDEGQLNLDSASLSVDIAQYALQLGTLTSPLNGIVTHEDVNVAGQNVTTQTTFSVADPSTKVFRANIPASYVDFVKDGMQAQVILDGSSNRISGTVVKVYPSKVTLSDGEEVYQVDIQSDAILNTGKLDQTGTAVIMTNAQNVILVPSWTVLAGKYIWIDNNGKPELKTVKVGQTHGDDIEITGGLSKTDRILTDPKAIAGDKYQML